MRRRLDLGASLVGRPRVLLMDEPTTGLDPRTRIDLWELIAELVNDGTTLLLTTQYLDEADRLADRIAVIDRGADDRVRHLRRAEGARRRRRARGAHDERGRPVAPGRAAAADLRPSAVTVDERGQRIRVSVVDRVESLLAAARAIEEAGIAIDDLGVHRPSLDDVFLALTGRGAEEAAGTQLGRADAPRRGASAASGRPRPSTASGVRAAALGAAGVLRRHDRDHASQPADARAHAAGGRVRVDPAGDLRAALPLRLRRLDPRSPATDRYADFLIPGIIVQTTLFGGSSLTVSSRRGHVEGDHRPPPLAADEPGGDPRRRARSRRCRATTFTLVARHLVGVASASASTRPSRTCRARRSSSRSPSASPSPGSSPSSGSSCARPRRRSSPPSCRSSRSSSPPRRSRRRRRTRHWLRRSRTNQPITQVVDSIRALTQGVDPATGPTLRAFAWSAGILVVCAVLSVRRFRNV